MLNACAANSVCPMVSLHCRLQRSIRSIIRILIYIHSLDFDTHLEMHSAEGTTFEDFGHATIEYALPVTQSQVDTSSSDSETPPRTPRQEGLCEYTSALSIGNLNNAYPSSNRRHVERGLGEVRRLSTSPIRRRQSKITEHSKRRRPQRLGVSIFPFEW